MRTLLLTLMLVLVTGCATFGTAAPEWPVKRILPSILKLYVDEPEFEGAPSDGQCTAIAITKRIAITATHCKPQHKDAQMYMAGGVIRVQIPLEEDLSDINGITVVRADRDAFEPIDLGPFPEAGTEVLVMGYGFDAPQPLFFHSVIISNKMLAPGEEAPFNMYLGLETIGGMSGGPIVNRKGQLVGIVLGGFKGVLQHLTWAIEYDTLKALYTKYR